MTKLKNVGQRARDYLKRSKKGLLVGLGFLCAESLFGLYTLVNVYTSDINTFPKPKTFTDHHRDAIGAVAWFYRYLRSTNCDDQTLRKAFEHKKTTKSIDSLFLQDDIKMYTEVKGFISIDTDSEGPFLRFYTTKTVNELFAEDLMQTKNPLEFLIKNASFYKEVTNMPANLFDSVIKQKRVDLLFRDYIYYSDNTAISNTDTSRRLFYDNLFNWHGRLIGEFHLHNNSNPPSGQDILLDPSSPSYVISKTAPFTFYRVQDKTYFKISPNNN